MTYGHQTNIKQLVQAGAVSISLDGFHASGTAEQLGNTPLDQASSSQS